MMGVVGSLNKRQLDQRQKSIFDKTQGPERFRYRSSATLDGRPSHIYMRAEWRSAIGHNARWSMINEINYVLDVGDQRHSCAVESYAI